MRKSVLVAAMVLVSAAAQADGLVSAVDPMWEPMPRGPEAKKAAGFQGNGGLISYGPNLTDIFRRCGGYVVSCNTKASMTGSMIELAT
jgi:hypothetical protein